MPSHQQLLLWLQFREKRFGKRRVIDRPNPGKPHTYRCRCRGDLSTPARIFQVFPKGSSSRASSRFRSSSVGSASTSTHISQLLSVNTPTQPFPGEINATNPSLSGMFPKDAGMVKKLREKEKLLSVIKENPMSRREHTLITKRTFGINKPKNTGIPHVASSSTMNTRAGRAVMVLGRAAD